MGQLKEEIIVKVTKRNKELNEYVQGEVSAMRKRMDNVQGLRKMRKNKVVTEFA